MIIITRRYDVDNPAGGRPITVVTRRAFADDDYSAIQHFLDERSDIPGYEWFHIDFEFTKL